MSNKDPFFSDLYTESERPGLLLLFSAVIVVGLSMAMAFLAARISGAGISEALGGATGSFLVSGVLTLLLSIKRSWRTAAFRTKAVMILSGIMALSSLARLANSASDPAGRIVKAVNAVSPKTIGEDVVMNGGVVGPDGGVTITIQLLAVAKNEINHPVFHEAVVKGSHQEVNSFAILRQFVRSGHRLTYKYIDKASLEIESITISASMLEL